MTKKLVDQLVKASYTNEALDPDKVEKIAGVLRRFELKKYIRALKMTEQRRTVTVASALPLDKQAIEEMKKTYPGKKIIVSVDPSLLIGMRITDNDTIYELNLHDNLQNMHEYIKE